MHGNLYCDLASPLHLFHNLWVRWNCNDAHLPLLTKTPMLEPACNDQEIQV